KLFPFSFISALLSRHCDADAVVFDSLRCEVLWRSPRCVGEDGGNEWLTGCQMMEALIQASPKQRLDGGVIHAEARPPRCLGA
ncbi:Pre-mRNA-splicing factor SLT11, partial [Dissostichus eleginoides]